MPKVGEIMPDGDAKAPNAMATALTEDLAKRDKADGVFAWDYEPGSVTTPPLVFLIEGEFGIGKTHLATTGPEPRVILDTDARSKLVAVKRPAYGKFVKSWHDVRSAIDAAMKLPKGTLILDSIGDMRDMVLADLEASGGFSTNHKQFRWGDVYDKFTKMIDYVRSAGWTLVFTGQLSDVYESKSDGYGSRTGDRAPSSFVSNKVRGWVDVAIRLEQDETGKVSGKILKNGLGRPGYVSDVVPHDRLTLDGIAETCRQTVVGVAVTAADVPPGVPQQQPEPPPIEQEPPPVAPSPQVAPPDPPKSSDPPRSEPSTPSIPDQAPPALLDEIEALANQLSAGYGDRVWKILMDKGKADAPRVISKANAESAVCVLRGQLMPAR